MSICATTATTVFYIAASCMKPPRSRVCRRSSPETARASRTRHFRSSTRTSCSQQSRPPPRSNDAGAGWPGNRPRPLLAACNRLDTHHVTRYIRDRDQIVRGQAYRTVLDHRQLGTAATGNRTPGTSEALGARRGRPDRESAGSSGQSPPCTRGRSCRTALHIYQRPVADLLSCSKTGTRTTSKSAITTRDQVIQP
jgi:hypothetical protein